MEAKVIEEAKKQAAELGAPILYAIVPVTSHEGTEFRFWALLIAIISLVNFYYKKKLM